MSITLSPATQKLLEDRLLSGPYRTADDVVQAALAALEDVESCTLDNASLDAIDEAEDQIEQGQHQEWKNVRDQVRAMFTK